MPRPKPVTVHTVAPAESRAGRREVLSGIDDLLQHANLTATDTSDPAVLQFAAVLNGALRSFSEGGSGAFWNWPVWAALAFGNVANLVRENGWHLRRCRVCARWFLAKAKNKKLCRRVACVRLVKAPQREAQRQHRRKQDELAKARARTAC
jgi:hypothetical protein